MSKREARHLVLLRRRYTSTTSKPITAPKTLISPLPFPFLPKTLAHPASQFCSGGITDRLRDRIHLLTEKSSSIVSDRDLDDIRAKISSIADEILAAADVQDVAVVLEARSAVDLIRGTPNGFASIELLSLLKPKTDFALEVRI